MAGELPLMLRYVRDFAQGGSQRSDAELLRQFVSHRDETAFAALLGRHGPLVLGVCRQVLGHEQDAEDAFQACFLVLAEKAATIHREQSLAPWLHRVALNIARTAQAETTRRRALERHKLAVAPRGSSDEVAMHDWQPLLHQEVDRLPEKYRAAIVLCYFNDNSHDEAAWALGWPLGTVKGRLSRARDLLRRRLARRGLALSAGAVAAALGQPVAADPVPTALVGQTLKAVLSAAAGGTIPSGVVSPAVLGLANGALRSIAAATPGKAMALAAALGVATLAAMLGSGLAHEVRPGNPPVATNETRSQPQADGDRPVDPDIRHALGPAPAGESHAKAVDIPDTEPEAVEAERALTIEQLIADLESDDGPTRMTATSAILRMGRDVLPDLQRAGARQVAGRENTAPQRLHVLYSLLDGFPADVPMAPSGFRSDRFMLYVEKACTQEQLAEWGARFGFTPSPLCHSGRPHCGAILVKGKTLPDVLNGLLTSAPGVVTIKFAYWE
jgi:RNA polymerase sigma factor (sigma-70 family)